MGYDFRCEKEGPLVRTARGPVRGYHYNGLDIFKGIPYASARRFHAPEEVLEWERPFNATNYGCVCPLMKMGKPMGEILTPHRYWVQDENCQNLNVWTPACDDGGRPVMVWLHGGGYTDGSSIEQVAYEGENMAKYGDCVVVSVNHRLNVIGYLDLSEYGEEYENSGNAGGDDMIAALRWVQKNIAAFGGNPDNVTVFGQSGGGAKVTTLLQSPEADGLYHKGINMSGIIGPILADSVGSGRDMAEALLKELNLKTVKELEEIPYTALAAAYQKVSPGLRAQGKYVGGTPKPNDHYAGDPLVVGFRSETIFIPVMAGTVFAEFNSFMGLGDRDPSMTEEEKNRTIRKMLGEKAPQLTEAFTKAYPERDVMDILAVDSVFRMPTIQYIRKRAEQGGKIYSYLFNQDFPYEGGKAPWHCSDIAFAFHNTDLIPIAQIPGITEKLEREMFEAWMNFSRTGHPGWEASTPEKETTMLFDANSRVVYNHDHELIREISPIMGAQILKLFSQNTDSIQH